MEERSFKNFYKYYSSDVQATLYLFLALILTIIGGFFVHDTLFLLTIFSTVLLFISFLVIISQAISFFRNKDDKYTFYTRIGFSETRQRLLDLGFSETVSEWHPSDFSKFTLKGIYENIPLNIQGSSIGSFEIDIPLLLEIDDSYHLFWCNFLRRYPPKKIKFDQTVLGKQINGYINQSIDKAFWEAINELQSILEEQEYRGQKLINYVDKD